MQKVQNSRFKILDTPAFHAERYEYKSLERTISCEFLVGNATVQGHPVALLRAGKTTQTGFGLSGRSLGKSLGVSLGCACKVLQCRNGLQPVLTQHVLSEARLFEQMQPTDTGTQNSDKVRVSNNTVRHPKIHRTEGFGLRSHQRACLPSASASLSCSERTVHINVTGLMRPNQCPTLQLCDCAL